MNYLKAPTHEGTRARRHGLASSLPLQRAFSLIEVLLAIFILGIGVISIAALFPAGIAQQQLSNDEMAGPAVANAAIDLIRSKVKPEYFGTFEEFDPDLFSAPPVESPRYTVPGDWSWIRPAVVTDNDPNTTTWPDFDPNPSSGNSTDYDDRGSIDIFNWYRVMNTSVSSVTDYLPLVVANSNPNFKLYGIPYNTVKYDNPNTPAFDPTPPRIIITQEERYYPMGPRQYTASVEAQRPQYVWDCAFRRFQGRILVAIFVYRVTLPGGGTAPNYRVAIPSGGDRPTLPVWLDLRGAPDYCANDSWDTGLGAPAAVPENRAVVLGTRNGVSHNLDDARFAWQQPRQWLIDQNNNIHRVIGANIEDHEQNTGDVQIELARPVVPVLGRIAGNQTIPSLTQYYYEPANLNPPAGPHPYVFVHDDVVTDIWYIPLSATNSDETEYILTPVYATVKEL